MSPEVVLTSKGCCEDNVRQSGHVKLPLQAGHMVGLIPGTGCWGGAGTNTHWVGPGTLQMLWKGQQSLWFVCGEEALDNVLGDPQGFLGQDCKPPDLPGSQLPPYNPT